MATITRREWMAAQGALALRAPQAARPNLLFIFSDQHSADMLGCYGNRQIRTPNLDRLASEGVRFNHCVSNDPVCSPYRAMLMTGQHPLYNGVFTNDVSVLTRNGKNFAEVLRDSGYRTGYIGKWHLYGGDRNRPIPAGPDRLGFDHTFLSNNCTLQFGAGKSYYWDDQGNKVFFPEWEPYGQARQAAAFLESCNGEQPFALFLSVHPPHDMGAGRYRTEPDLMGLYDPAKLRLRPNVTDTPAVREQYQGYMAMCTGVDKAYGWVLDKLKKKGLDKNTLVVYTSDHGDLLNSHGRPWAKSFPEAESCRVPMMIRWPGRLPARAETDLLFGALDIMPTILGLMGMPIPKTCQGQDLSQPILKRDQHAVSSIPLFYFGPDWRGVYTERFTYSFGAPSWNVLYDRKKDPHERDNLFESPGNRKVKEELHKLTLEWMSKFEDPFAKGADLMQLCFNTPRGPVSKVSKTGRLPGRPIDLVRRRP